jgi:LmbE family N-acetylglucosaminyl deacetylase
MMVNGVWYDNMTCPRCRHRHPGHITCNDATQLAMAQRPVGEYMYGVICSTHGPTELTEAQYIEQLERPDDRWTCPICEAVAEWDDDSGCCQ